VTARLRAGLLLFAAIQFVVLTTIAMAVYAGGNLVDPWARGYTFTRNFLSDLGATRAWSGQPNHPAALLFGIALGTLGAAFVGFAGTWRTFAFAHGRARLAGIASEWFGITSGCAFVAVAVTPVNRALAMHNALVVAAFALLFGYATAMTILWWCNGSNRVQRAASLGYLVITCAYVASVLFAVHEGVTTRDGQLVLVVTQKVMAYASMMYVGFVTLTCRARNPIAAT
jgi:hypothetical protein